MSATNSPVVVADRHGIVTSARSYEAASDTQIQDWQPSNLSADAAIIPNRPKVTSRALDSERNFAHIAGGIQVEVDNVVGAGLKLSAKPDFEILQQEAAWASKWSRSAEAGFRRWGEDIDRYCDATRRLSFAQMQIQAYRTFITQGEVLAVMEWLPGRGGRYSTAVRMVDPARLCTPDNKVESDKLRDGIQFDRFGAPMIYHIRDSHPQDYPSNWLNKVKYKPVRAQTQFGRRQVIHIFDQQRPAQSRGITKLASILKAALKLDKFEDATLDAAVLNAVLAATIESEYSTASIGQGLGVANTDNDPVSQYFENTMAFHQANPIKVGGGRVAHLFPNESLKFNTAEHPSENFESFETAMLRRLASGLGISYEQFARDYSKTNYAGARAGIEESWRYFMARRNTIVADFSTNVYCNVLEELIDKGDVVLPPTAPRFREAKTAYCRSRWIGQGQPSIDSLKEERAEDIRLLAGRTNYDAYYSARGMDWEVELEQFAKERERIEELGLEEALLTTNPVENDPGGEPDDETEDE